jgi:peptidoglycan/LPS O-acetylase OafA/YrhL
MGLPEKLPASRDIASLDGLRAVSIASVVIGHSMGSMPAFLQRISVIQFLGNGSLGVAIFFVISGFLITHLLVKEQSATGNINLRRFYLRRTFRIFPPFYVYLAVLAVLWMARIVPQDWGSFLSAATYTWNYNPWAVGLSLAHLWSLSLEEQFYLLWPACLKLLGRERALRMSIAVILLAPLSRVATYYLAVPLRPLNWMMLHTRIDTLLFGCVLALLWKNKQFQDRLRPLFHPVLLIVAAVLLVWGSQMLWVRYRGAYGATLGVTLDSALITLLVAYLIQNPHSWAGWVLNTSWVRHVGVISYSLYLWQGLYLTSVLNVFPLNILLAFLSAELSFRLVERPALRLRDYFEAKLVQPVRSRGPDRREAVAAALG